MRAHRISYKIWCLLLSVFLFAGCFSKAAFRGEALASVAPASEIDLPDHNGNNFRLGEMRGKVVLIFFGFTNCVDECPLTMAHIKLALDKLEEDAENVQVVLVSTDPVRDTPLTLKDYLGKFNGSFIGIPGTVDTLQTVWDEYGVEVEDGGETHSSLTYVVDKNGNLRITFDPDTLPEDIAHDLNILLAE